MRLLLAISFVAFGSGALGQTAVNVRGPTGPAGPAAPGSTPTFTVTEQPEFAWVANDATFEATGTAGTSLTVSGSPFAVKAPSGITCARTVITISPAYYTVGTGLGWPASYTIIAVVRFDSIATPSWIFGSAPSGGLNQDIWGGLHARGGGELRYVFGNGTQFSQGDTPPGSVSIGPWYVLTLRYTTGSNQSEVWINGVAQIITPVSTSASAAGGDGVSPFVFGRVGLVSTNPVQGTFCAVYAWTSSISDADRSAVETAWVNGLQ